MLKTLEKYWPIIFIFLILGLLACLLFWPGISRPLALGVLLLSTVIGIAFSVQKHVRAYQKGQLDQPSTMRNIFVDEFGSLVTIAASILMAGKVAQVVGMAAGRAVERPWPGVGIPVGILAGLLAGILVGIGIGRLVQSTWGKLIKRPVVPVENEI